MTLAIQNKGKAYLDNKSIIYNIIKKENGVNPFLTVMNFKISFKTWLKQSKAVARLKRARENDEEIAPEDEDS
jgi:chloramphenicol O-acetyltransferase